MAAYQAAATVGAAVQSALDQTVASHEVIVVDGGSTDGTVDVVASFGDRVQLIHQESRGAAAAVNIGARLATGDFVAGLDADDLYLPRRLEALSALGAERPDLDLLMTDAFLEVDNRRVSRYCHETPFAVEDQVAAIFDRCYLVAAAFRRERFLEIGAFDEALATGYDWDCWIRLLLAGSRAGMVDSPLYVYRLLSGSLSDDRVSNLQARVALLEKALDDSDLRSEELPALERALRKHRDRAQLAVTEAALRSGANDARRQALAVAFGSGFGFGPRTRLKAFLAALAPRTAGRRLDVKEARTGESRLQRSRPR
jgi:glycosyltransferase involved in cell wall biosynthesis